MHDSASDTPRSGWSRAAEVADATAFWAGAGALLALPVGTAPFEILFGVSMAATAGGLVLSRSQPMPRWWPGAAALLIVALASSLLALDPERSQRQWSKLLYLAAALGVMRALPGLRQLALVFLAFAALVCLHSVVALGAWLRWGGEVRTEIDYLQLAQLAVMTLALVAPLALSRELRPAMRLGAGLASLVLATHCLLSGSRAALLCLAALVLAELLERSWRALLVLPPVIFAVFASLPESRRERIRDALRVEAADQKPPSSLRMRLDMARTGLAIAHDRPWLGVGLDGVRLVYDGYKVGSLRDDPPGSEGRRPRKWHNLHNDFVQVAAELGYLGLAAYWVLLGQILGRPLAPAGGLSRALARGVRYAMLLFVVGGLFYKCFLNFYPWRLFVLLAGLDAAIEQRRRYP